MSEDIEVVPIRGMVINGAPTVLTLGTNDGQGGGYVRKALHDGFASAKQQAIQILRKKQDKFTRLGHPAATNKAKPLDELISEINDMGYP